MSIDVLFAKKQDIKEVESVLNDLKIKDRALRRDIHDEMNKRKQQGEKLDLDDIREIAETLRDLSRNKGRGR